MRRIPRLNLRLLVHNFIFHLSAFRMSARVGATNLEEAVRELARHWQHTRNYWRDQKALEFERTYLEKLPHSITRAKQIMEEMDLLLRKVKQDCE